MKRTAIFLAIIILMMVTGCVKRSVSVKQWYSPASATETADCHYKDERGDYFRCVDGHWVKSPWMSKDAKVVSEAEASVCGCKVPR